jgi:protoporphyrinogen oxidase
VSSPPAYTAYPDQPAVSTRQDAELALLIREARALDPALRKVGKTKLLRMAREFAAAAVLDQRDRQARQASAEEFGDWLRSNYWRALRGGIYVAPPAS